LAANYFPAILPSPGNTESKKAFLIPNWNNRGKRKKETLAKKRNQNKEKKIPHIRAGYQDPKPKGKLIRPTIQVKNLTCLLTRVMFQESRRPSTMQSKQCRHFQRRLISKPLTLNRTFRTLSSTPFLKDLRYAATPDTRNSSCLNPENNLLAASKKAKMKTFVKED